MVKILIGVRELEELEEAGREEELEEELDEEEG